MKDRNVTIYGLMNVSPDQSVTGVAMRAVQVSDEGMIYSIMTIGGNGIEATSPWSAGNIDNDGWRGPFMPVTAANFMVGNDGADYYSPMTRLDDVTAGLAANHLNVAPLMATDSLFDAPAENTPATLTYNSGAAYVWVDTISVTVIADDATPSDIVAVILSEDPSGATPNIWQQNLRAPAGGCVTQTWKVNRLCALGWDVLCNSPGVGASVSLAVTFNDTLGVAGIYPSPNA